MWRYVMWVVLGAIAVGSLLLPHGPADQGVAPVVQQQDLPQLSLKLSQS